MADALDIFKRLTDLRILEPTAAQAVSSALGAGATGPTLAKALRDQGLITEFQADAIGRGCPEELVYGENGRFICHELLGQGGMGCVYKAWQGSVKRWVALKTINGKTLRADALKEMKRRFQRELEAAGQLEHLNIIRVYDGGVQGDESYLAMECVEGATLHKIIVRNGPRPWAQACEWIAQAAEGLAYAHEKRIVHRDIKPDNLMLSKRGTIKVLDLGLARFLETDDSLTRTASTMGTIDYMAPEQGEDAKRADARSDIYSLGCTLYFLCAGKAVFAHRNGTIPKIHAHGTEAPPKLRDACTDAPAKLEAIYQRMLRKRPADRYQSMSEIAEELRALIVKPVPQPPAARSPAPSMPGWVGAALALSAAAVVILGLVLAIVMRQPVETPEARPGPVASRPDAGSTAKSLVPDIEQRKMESEPNIKPAPVPAPTSLPDSASAAKKTESAPTAKVEAIASKTQATPAEEKKAAPRAVASYEGLKVGEERSDNGLGMKLVWCPPGTFLMGGQRVNVRLTRGFWIGKYEVTQEEWRKVMGTTIRDQAEKGTIDKNLYGEGPKHPMYYVSYHDAMEFCRKLTEQERGAGRLPVGWRYTLPTEAQWEYAGRAGTTTEYAFGDRLDKGQANSGGNVGSTTEVGSYAGNAWGLCDVHGNVWEWCLDDWSDKLRGGDDPFVGKADGSSNGSNRVSRGGSWSGAAVSCGFSYRNRGDPSYRYGLLGFRLLSVP